MILNRAQIAALNALRDASESFKLEQGYYNGTDGMFVLADNRKAWFITAKGVTHRLANFPPADEFLEAARG